MRTRSCAARIDTYSQRNHQGTAGRWCKADTIRRYAIAERVVPNLMRGKLPSADDIAHLDGPDYRALQPAQYPEPFRKWCAQFEKLNNTPRCARGATHEKVT